MRWLSRDGGGRRRGGASAHVCGCGEEPVVLQSLARRVLDMLLDGIEGLHALAADVTLDVLRRRDVLVLRGLGAWRRRRAKGTGLASSHQRCPPPIPYLASSRCPSPHRATCRDVVAALRVLEETALTDPALPVARWACDGAQALSPDAPAGDELVLVLVRCRSLRKFKSLAV